MFIQTSMLDIKETRYCLYCGTPISGRRDKKFCCLACKNAFNNKKVKEQKNFRKGIIRKLSTNYEILESLLCDKTTFASFELLEDLGFEDGYVTGSRRLKGGRERFSCFDISYLKSEDKIFDIKRNAVPQYLTITMKKSE